MSYTPPTWDDVNFELESYTEPTDSHNIVFDFIDTWDVTTLPASNITYNSATLNAEIDSYNDDETNTRKGYVYDTVSRAEPTVSPELSEYENVVDKGVLVNGAFPHDLTDLAPNEEYYVRAFGYSDEEGYKYGEEVAFQTPPFIELTTEPATNISYTTVTFNANITEILSPSVNIRFKYTVVGSGVWEETTPEPVTEVGTFSQSVSGLNPNTNYKFEVVAERDGFEEAGELKYFTTLEADLEYHYLTVRNVKDTNATFRVEPTLIVGDLHIKFQYKKKADSVWIDTPTQTISSPQVVTQLVSGLDDDIYNVRAVFDGLAGEVVGDTLTFNNGVPGAFWDNAVKRFDIKYNPELEETVFEVDF